MSEFLSHELFQIFSCINIKLSLVKRQAEIIYSNWGLILNQVLIKVSFFIGIKYKRLSVACSYKKVLNRYQLKKRFSTLCFNELWSFDVVSRGWVESNSKSLSDYHFFIPASSVFDNKRKMFSKAGCVFGYIQNSDKRQFVTPCFL